MDTKELLTAGIDVGSASIKVAVMADQAGDGARLLVGRSERIRRRETATVVASVFEDALAEAGLERGALDYVATTGEGEQVDFRTGHFYGMTTHARGALFLDPEVRACVDVGALHARAILIDERAKVLGYRMTSQCASGSGQFLENISRYLGVTMAEIGPLSCQADAPEVCSSICAVLAETDVINMVSRGIATANILKGIHLSMASRFVKLLRSAGAEQAVLVTGGLAADVGLMAALRETVAESGSSIDVRFHADSVLAGAIGAALWGAFRARKVGGLGLSLDAAGAVTIDLAAGLEGAVALVTGGAGGIGAAIIAALESAGARAVSADAAHGDDEGPWRVPVDVRDPAQVAGLVERVSAELGGLDLVVHCAGRTRDAVLWKLSDEDWRDVLSVNLDAAFYLLRAAAPHLRRSERGAVVLISSINGERGKLGQSNYAASKAGLIGLAKSAARELGRDGVRVNVVAPGFVLTAMTEALPEPLRRKAVEETVLGRPGRPEDVAGAVLFLCSGLAQHVTGQVLRVDGGQLIA